jgi:beta-glucanase (GH16 family)
LWAFDVPFFVLLNVAVGGNFPGPPDSTTTFPQEMLVDYVRYDPTLPSGLASPASGPEHFSIAFNRPLTVSAHVSRVAFR